jgi:RNA polymerase sigma-70 factor (ECF subfamily)
MKLSAARQLERRTVAQSGALFAVSAQIMRRIPVDFARKSLPQARRRHASGFAERGVILLQSRDADLVELDEALTALANVDSRKSPVVEMRFSGGLSNREVAEVLVVPRKR